jgi:hypothetical protein
MDNKQTDYEEKGSSQREKELFGDDLNFEIVSGVKKKKKEVGYKSMQG